MRTAVRMLDNVIDINYYSVPQARASNMRHRPVGLGIMGFQDALYELRMPYSSDAAVEFADRSMEAVSYFAIEASSELAKERGSYASFEGSLWSHGILPLDSLRSSRARTRQAISRSRTTTRRWTGMRLRRRCKTDGMRNSNVMAIAPTATIANITGVSQSIEPTYQNLYVKSNLSGEFTVVNPYLVHDLKALGLWDKVMVNDLKYYDGSLQEIDRIPADLKAALRDGLRSRAALARRRRRAPSEVDRPGAVAEPVHRRCIGQKTRRDLSHGVDPRFEDHVLPACARRDEHRKIDGRPRPAERGFGRRIASRRQRSASVAGLRYAMADPAEVPLACAINDPTCEACQ